MKAILIQQDKEFQGYISDEATYEGVKSERLTFKRPLEEIPHFIIPGSVFLRLMALDKENGTFDRSMFKEPLLSPIPYENRPTPSQIARYIFNMVPAGSRDFTYIILGKPGPTGKTWLTKALVDNGFEAFEITEDIVGLVNYIDDNHNYFSVNNEKKQVTIVLNTPLEVD